MQLLTATSELLVLMGSLLSKRIRKRRSLSCSRAITAALFLAASLSSLAGNAAGVVLGPSHVLLPGVQQGELLLGELGCVYCHSAPEAIRARLTSRSAPVLGSDGLKLTPQFIRAYLLDPSKELPGTTMPDMPAGLSDQQRTAAVDALVHYLVSACPGDSETNSTGNLPEITRGRDLFHTIGCVACHAPEIPKGDADAESVSRLRDESVPLPNLAKKITLAELTKFLLNPLQYRHSGRMPSLNLSAREAHALAVYLLRDQAPSSQNVPGLFYQYFEAPRIQQISQLDDLLPLDEGSTSRVDLSPKHRATQFGFRFLGLLHAPEAGEYSFFLTSDDGSRLYLDGKLVVDNDGDHGPREVPGKVVLQAGDHTLMVLYFNDGGGSDLSLDWQRPGSPRESIPTNVLSHSERKLEPLDNESFVVDAAKASQGKKFFSSLGCVSCHGQGLPGIDAVPRAKPLLELNPNEGCLADKPSKNAARYSLNQEQLKSLRDTLKNKQAFSQPLDSKSQASYTFTRLNCVACHSRDGLGGPSAMRSPYFSSVGEVELGDEGRVPPILTGVGNKLRPEWLQEVLCNNASVRPYMATRMPQFGRGNITSLIGVLAQADGPLLEEPPAQSADTKYGRKLVGSTGLSCVSCHTFAGQKSLGIPAMDLTLMHKRLRADWFTRYLLDPVSLRPGTRMPTFWPERKSTRADILGGDTLRQIKAIWAFLESPMALGLPDGLVQGKIELVADKEAIIYRNFITGSPRSIGVGYPEKANLDWDANEMRLVSIWQGGFIDAAQHREGRGNGFVNPLGNNLVKFPSGPPLAILENLDQKWPNTAANISDYHMKGYVLDNLRRPAFHYTFLGVQVEDLPLPKNADPDAVFIRTLTFNGPKPKGNLWFRAWAGSRVEVRPDGSWVVDGTVKMKFETSSGAPRVRQSESRSELLVPVNLKGGEAKIIQEIIW